MPPVSNSVPPTVLTVLKVITEMPEVNVKTEELKTVEPEETTDSLLLTNIPKVPVLGNSPVTLN